MEKFHPELGGEVMGHPYFNSLHPGRSSPESLDFIHQAVLLSTWHWCWCSYLSTTWRDAGATKRWWKNGEKWWKLDTIKGCPNDEILHH